MARRVNGQGVGEIEKIIAARLGVTPRTARRYLRHNSQPKSPRTEQLKPWVVEGISRRTWYRRRQRGAGS